MKNIKNLFIVIFILSLSSCFNDKGNYDYKDIYKNKVDIILNSSIFYGYVDEPIKIIPTLRLYNENQTDTTIYKWEYKFPELGVVCNTKIMDVVIEDITIDHTYFGLIVATDTTTGAKYTSKVGINFKNPYKTGILVLSESNDKSDLALIRTINQTDEATEYDVVNNIYQKFNDDILENNYNKIVTNRNGAFEFRLMQDGNKSLAIDSKSYSKSSTFNEEFIDDIIPNGAYATDFTSVRNLAATLTSDNKLYTKVSSYSQGLPYSIATFAKTPVMYEGQILDVTHLFNSEGCKNLYFYDAFYHSFFQTSGAYNEAGKLDQLKGPESYNDSLAPAPNNLEGYKVLKGELTNKTYSMYKMITLIQNVNTSDMYIYTFSGRYEVASNIAMSKFTESSKIGDNTIFHILKKRPYILFTDTNDPKKLYCYDIRTNLGFLIKSYDSNITYIESSAKSNDLYVGLENGEFYIQDISDEILISSDKDNVLYSTSFNGKISAILYKPY